MQQRSAVEAHQRIAILVSYFIVIVSAFLLTSCESSPKQACFDRDWYEFGRQAGILGRPMDSEQVLSRPGCERADITADYQRAISGHSAGLMIYCSPTNGFEVGNEGELYQNVCPQPLEADFLTALRRGAEVKKLTESNRALETEIRSLSQRIDSLKILNQSTNNHQSTLQELQSRKKLQKRQIDSLRRSL